MSKENEALAEVCSQVSKEVNEMYQRYRAKKQLEDETDTERQLEILSAKKYISSSFIVDLYLLSDYYAREMTETYEAALKDYKVRIEVLLEEI